MFKKMTITAVSFLLLSLSYSAFAEEATNKAKNKMNRMEKMATQLSLTAEQKQQVSTIMAENKVKMMTLRTERYSKIEAILTPEQAEKFKKMQEQNHNKKKNQYKKNKK